MSQIRLAVAVALMCLVVHPRNARAQGPNDTVWTPLFNGVDLNDWDKKIRYRQLNVDPWNTFRVAPCVNGDGNCLEVNYSEYTNFTSLGGEMHGHIGYKVRPFSYYVIRAEYQFFGTQVTGGPGWANQNNGLMLHSQSAASMSLNQDFPNSLEAQLLGPANNSAGGTGTNGTMNLCTPGTEARNSPTGDAIGTHCTAATQNTRTTAPAWMNVSAVVLGDSVIYQKVGGTTVRTYYKTTLDAGGARLTGGYILLQAESAPIRFRRVDVANLIGCKSNTSSPNYRSYFVKDSAAACAGVPIHSSASQERNWLSYQAASGSISLNLPGEFTLQITDLAGKAVLEKSGRGRQSVDLKPIKVGGVYFLTLKRPQGNYTQKLFLER